MPRSDSFGSDDDDEAFLAAATQAEAVHHASFAASPRPSKKRRITQSPMRKLDRNASLGTSRAHIDTDDRSSGFVQSLSRTSGQENVPEEDPDYYLPGELGSDDQNAKKSKYKIHIPRDATRLPHQIFSQTQHDLDSDPTEIRGPVWKRPPSLPSTSQSIAQSTANVRNTTIQSPRSLNPPNSLNKYFQPQLRPNPSPALCDDAALAARLQEREDRISRHQNMVKHRPAQQPRPVHPASNAVEDLADLPSDAFSSSIGDRPPERDAIVLSSQPTTSNLRPQALRGPQTGLKQMNMFGRAATQELSVSQAATKRHAWPLKSKEEPPTHHKLDEAAMATWVYPTNLGTIRDYQFNIVSRSLYLNTLVALPTGLGKTFIAATIMLNYYRWTSDAQLVFMAPTKPLIAQQMEACYQIAGIPRGDTVLMTGETSPANRAAEWSEKRVFFMTPQTVINDLKTGICDPKKIVLAVVDEAHKATGGYAYTEVVKFLHRFNNSFRVLALTATPGSSVESVQAVINNLGIARVELRTEQSLDIRQYTHEKQTETEIFEYSDEQERIMDLFARALRPAVEKVCSQNAYWSRDPMQLTAYGLNMARQKWMASDSGRRAPASVKGMVNTAMTVLASLAHSIGLLKYHGIRPFYSGVLDFQKTVDSGQTKGKTATQIAKSEDFVKMMGMVRAWTNNPDFLGHPKLDHLRSVILNHFLDAGEGRRGDDVPPSATRVMVFVNYRDSAEDICRALKRNEPMIRPHVFVGQAASKNSEGMDQKRQNAVIQDFKAGRYNTLVATSIGEEGLDIGTVDLIVCYDASSSPIRMLQRIGRTGRKRIGHVSLLLMKGKEENDYTKAQDNYSWIQKTIADESRYTYCETQSPRILPKHVQPAVDKRMVEIPVENTQPVDTNEKNRKGRGKAKAKRPPKKFHMPDGVETGFVRASRLGSGDTDEEAPARRKTPAKRKVMTPRQLEPEIVQLPFLQDVLLTDGQRIELEQKYAQTADLDAELFIRPPDTGKHPETLREPGKTKHVRHGQAVAIVAQTLRAVRDVDETYSRRMKAALRLSDLKDGGFRDTVSRIDQILVENTHGLANDVAISPGPLCLAAPQSKKASNKPKPKGRQTNSTTVTPAQQTRGRGRPKKRQALQRIESHGSAAGEGDESSPEPTPADMRLGTQGIDLGSRDTSGEDDDRDELDSELESFIANTSDPIEMIPSSLPHAETAPKPRRLKRKNTVQEVRPNDYFTDSEGDHSLGNGSDSDVLPAAKARQRRVIVGSDSDD